MAQFQWIQYAAARNVLAQRLADPNKLFWVDAELGIYLTEALRTYNALTEVWNSDFVFQTNTASVWYDLGILIGSPRIQTVKDIDLYTIMEYHLIEPPTGGTWTGTSQFAIADLQGALQRRRDEVIQFSGCNLSQLAPLASSVNTVRLILSDTILEPRRIRFLPDSTPVNYGPPVTLTREDRAVFDAFEHNHLQIGGGIPASWSLVAGPPLSVDMDVAPSVPGSYDLIALLSGQTFSPPSGTLLSVPDDWTWVCKWGALSDLLSRESEATDRLRAAFCLQRYLDGLQAMRASNWLVDGEINGVPVDLASLAEFDAYSPEWQTNETWPTIVVAGMDLIAAVPVVAGTGVDVTVVGNAPIPVLDTDFVQVSRDTFDAVLGYAQVLATFKQGGAEFTDAQQLMKEFALMCQAQNARLSKIGLFPDVLRSEGKREDEVQER